MIVEPQHQLFEEQSDHDGEERRTESGLQVIRKNEVFIKTTTIEGKGT